MGRELHERPPATRRGPTSSSRLAVTREGHHIFEQFAVLETPKRDRPSCSTVDPRSEVYTAPDCVNPRSAQQSVVTPHRQAVKKIGSLGSETAPGGGADAATVLVVDDERSMRDLIVRSLERHRYQAASAGTAQEARAMLRGLRFSLIVSDIQMPGESGLELIEQVRAADPDIGVLMVSGEQDPAVAQRAAELGAFGYLVKPFSPEQLLISVQNAIRRRELEISHRNYQERLERTVETRTEELRGAVHELEASRRETIQRLSLALEMRDSVTGAHITRIGHLSQQLARAIGLPEAEASLIGLAAPMHDVGKIAIRDEVLLKPGPLSPIERKEMESHCEIGHRILSGSGAQLLDLAATIALTHHERFDGQGYPNGLVGPEIPVAGRIVSVVDVFDALLSDRPYRSAWTTDEALSALRGGAGTQFDPDVIEAFFEEVDVMTASAPLSA